MTRMTSPIVSTARCTGQTAVASIPRLMALFLSAVRSQVLLMECMRLANGASNTTLVFTPSTILPGNLAHSRTRVLKVGGKVKRKLTYG